jgi:pyruvate/2-oxoglutarate/acetoin dehydrogenase E1 component
MSNPDHLAQVVAELLREDPRRILLGEDVAEGGMIGLSKAAVADPTLEGRVISTPLTTTAGLAHAAGLALGGVRPIVLLPSAATLVEGMAALREIAALAERAGRKASLLFIAPNGPGFGLGGSSAACFEAVLASTPGLQVRTGGGPTELEAALRSAALLEDELPTVLLLPRSSLVAAAPEAEIVVELKEDLHRVRDPEAAQATVLCWGGAVEAARLAAEAAEEAGYPSTVLELCSLAPLDVAGIVEAAAETGKIVIAHDGPRTHGFGAELAARIADEAILHLDAPILRVTGAETLPSSPHEHEATPSAAAIAEAIVSVATY